MKKMKYDLKPIGKIHSKYMKKTGVPIQGRLKKNSKGVLEIFPEFKAGLKDVDGFSHIYILFYFHKSKGYSLHVKPFLDKKERGLFSTRAPKRPNQIGMTIVKIIKIKDNKIYFENCDMINDTPVLDIKPYVPRFDNNKNIKIGWLKGKIKQGHLSDKRFN